MELMTTKTALGRDEKGQLSSFPFSGSSRAESNL